MHRDHYPLNTLTKTSNYRLVFDENVGKFSHVQQIDDRRVCVGVYICVSFRHLHPYVKLKFIMCGKIDWRFMLSIYAVM